MQVTYLGLDSATRCSTCTSAAGCTATSSRIRLLSGRRSDRRLRGKLSDFGIATVLGAHSDDGEFTGRHRRLPQPRAGGGRPAGRCLRRLLAGPRAAAGGDGPRVLPGDGAGVGVRPADADPEIPASLPPRLASVLAGMDAALVGDRIPLEDARAEFERAAAEQIASRQPPVAPQHRLRRPARAIAEAPPDREFTRITGIAARLLRVPSSFVVLGDPREEAAAFVPDAHRAELAASLAAGAAGRPRRELDGRGRAHRPAHGRGGCSRRRALDGGAADPRRLRRPRGRARRVDALPRRFGSEEAAVLVDLAGLVGHEETCAARCAARLFSRDS